MGGFIDEKRVPQHLADTGSVPTTELVDICKDVSFAPSYIDVSNTSHLRALTQDAGDSGETGQSETVPLT